MRDHDIAVSVFFAAGNAIFVAFAHAKKAAAMDVD